MKIIQIRKNILLATLVLFSIILFSSVASAVGITNLASFNGRNGSKPSASLILDSDGVFYGTTIIGGTKDKGTIFSFNPSSNVLTNLASFNDKNGRYPTASLTLGSNGLFYGTTKWGGIIGPEGGLGYGTIFSVDAGISSKAPQT